MQNRAGGPFPFHHGRLSLSFAGTLGYRTSDAPFERVDGAQRLGEWLIAAGLVRTRKPPEIDPLTYRRAIELREAIFEIASAFASGSKPKRDGIAVINAAAKRWSSVPQLEPATLRFAARPEADAARLALGRVAADAIELFGDAALRANLRACEAGDCSAIFLNPGRGRARRWCSMARCGNRAKVAAFRARQKEA